jgi:hypothetical protein
MQVLRPWCHFELPESDYVAGGRRNPDLPGPSGVLELLDPATKVCGAPDRLLPSHATGTAAYKHVASSAHILPLLMHGLDTAL